MLLFLGLQRVSHDLAIEQKQHLCTRYSLSIHMFMDILAIVNSVEMNIFTHVSFQIVGFFF